MGVLDLDLSLSLFLSLGLAGIVLVAGTYVVPGLLNN